MELSVFIRHLYNLFLIAFTVQMIREQNFVTTFHNHKDISDGARLPWQL